MTAKNPPGHPLSGQVFESEDGELVVTYRPRFKGRKGRPRLLVPADVAELLAGAQLRETDRRQALAEDEQPRRRKKRAKKAAKKTAKKTAKRRAAPARERPARRRKTPARRVAAASEQLADISTDLARPGQQELFSNPRGAPSLARLGTCADLGRVLEVCVELPNGEHALTSWKRNFPRLLWSPSTRSLVWVHGRAPTARRKGATRSDGAARVFGAWAQREATSTSTLKIPACKLKLQGRAVYIVYKSDKWGPKGGKTKNYQHDFGPSVKTYHCGSVWAVRGGRLTVTERGIVF